LTERKLGVGVIGCGNIANGAHLPNDARNPRVRIVAVADVDVERARATADGRDAVELVLAIYRSAELGQPVDLPLTRAGARALAAV
jgi:hypothetical protein